MRNLELIISTLNSKQYIKTQIIEWLLHEGAAHTVILGRLSRHASCHTKTIFHVNNVGPFGN